MASYICWKQIKTYILYKNQLSSPDLTKQEVTGWCEQRDCASQLMNLIYYSAKQPPESQGDRELSDESGPEFAANLDGCLVGKYLWNQSPCCLSTFITLKCYIYSIIWTNHFQVH